MGPAGSSSWAAADSWAGVRAVVGGLAVSGFAAADALVHVGADVTVLDDADSEALQEKATLLSVLGADVRLGPGSTARLPEGTDVVVVTPGMPPRVPLLVEASARGVPIWGEVELAWRLRGTRRRPLAVRHRQQRQDHHRADARRDAARRRPAQRGGRQRRHTAQPGRDGPGRLRRAGGRAVQLPAALGAQPLAAGQRGAQRRPRPPRLVRRRDGRVRARQGPGLRRRPRSPASTTSPTR